MFEIEGMLLLVGVEENKELALMLLNWDVFWVSARNWAMLVGDLLVEDKTLDRSDFDLDLVGSKDEFLIDKDEDKDRDKLEADG